MADAVRTTACSRGCGLGVGSPSTTSAPATRRSPTCSSCRSRAQDRPLFVIGMIENTDDEVIVRSTRARPQHQTPLAAEGVEDAHTGAAAGTRMRLPRRASTSAGRCRPTSCVRWLEALDLAPQAGIGSSASAPYTARTASSISACSGARSSGSASSSVWARMRARSSSSASLGSQRGLEPGESGLARAEHSPASQLEVVSASSKPSRSSTSERWRGASGARTARKPSRLATADPAAQLVDSPIP